MPSLSPPARSPSVPREPRKSHAWPLAIRQPRSPRPRRHPSVRGRRRHPAFGRAHPPRASSHGHRPRSRCGSRSLFLRGLPLLVDFLRQPVGRLCQRLRAGPDQAQVIRRESGAQLRGGALHRRAVFRETLSPRSRRDFSADTGACPLSLRAPRGPARACLPATWDSASLTIRLISSSDRPESSRCGSSALCRSRGPAPRRGLSRWRRCSNVTSICGTPRDAGGMPTRSKRPRVLF